MQRFSTHWKFCFGAIFLALLVHSAFGRAGGGGHFSGGGGGGGSHGGGGGFGGGGGGGFGGGFNSGSGGGAGFVDDVFVLIVLIVLIYAITQAVLESQRKQTLIGGAAEIKRANTKSLIENLKAADPAFDPDHFYQRVSQAFLNIQAAWCAQDLHPIEPFVSDAVSERFGLQIREQQALGIRDRMENVRVRGVQLANLTQSDVFETVTLRINATAVDYEASLTDGHYLSGSREPEDFTEFWTFIRRRGTASISGDGLIEGRCPNCGAAIRISQAVTCEHCGAVLRSGRYDWVLCEITQASEWRPREQRPIPGYTTLHAKDAGLSLDDLEDRASVIFWRRMEADRTNNPAPLRKVALESFMNDRAATRDPQSASWQWFGDVGVGSVDTLALLSDAEFDRAVVRIAWSGTRFAQASTGKTQRGDETSVIREMFVLVRKVGLQTDPDKGITSAHCPGCGAPVSNNLSDACESCGKVLNDGSAGWVLESIESGASERVASLLREARDGETHETSPGSPVAAPSSKGLLLWALKLAASDGEIDSRERQMIEHFAANAALPKSELDSLVAAALADRLDAPQPADRDETLAWLTALIGVALADGKLSRGEATLLKSLADKAGLSDADIRLLMKKEQARAIEAARDALRGNHP